MSRILSLRLIHAMHALTSSSNALPSVNSSLVTEEKALLGKTGVYESLSAYVQSKLYAG